MKEFVLVISMWGHTGESGDWEYRGNQMVLDQVMTRTQCEFMVVDGKWKTFYENQNYKMVKQCFPIDCQGKNSCGLNHYYSKQVNTIPITSNQKGPRRLTQSR